MWIKRYKYAIHLKSEIQKAKFSMEKVFNNISGQWTTKSWKNFATKGRKA